MKKVQIMIKTTEEEKELIKKEAMKHGYMNLSAFVRDRCIGREKQNVK